LSLLVDVLIHQEGFQLLLMAAIVIVIVIVGRKKN